MAEPVPPDMPALRGGSGPHETASSVTVGSLADRAQSALSAAMGHVAAVLLFLKAELADLRADAEAADASEAAARAAAVTAASDAASSADSAIRTDFAAADASVRTDFAAADAALQTQVSAKAPTASPTFTGSVNAPNPPQAQNNTVVATTAWVTAKLGGYAPAGTYAPLNSPAFTGEPAAPTAGPGDNTTKLATTAYVMRSEGYVLQQTIGGAGIRGAWEDDASAAAAGVAVGQLYHRSSGSVYRRMA